MTEDELVQRKCDLAMDLKTNLENNILTVYPQGRITTDLADDFEQALTEAVSSNESAGLVLDLKELEYIASSGLRVVLKTHKKLKKLRIINASPAVYDIFDVVGLTDIFDIERAKQDDPEIVGGTLNNTAWDTGFKPVALLFEEQVKAHPDRMAVVSTALSYTYAELNEVANRIANALRYYNVRPDDTVMILLPRNVMVYAVNLGILKAGAAFVPVSTEYPDERISYIYHDAECRHLITTHGIANDRMDLIIEIGKRPLFLEHIMTSPWEENPQVRIDGRDLAYCIYTSGSTGKPKGVMIEQKNLYNFLHHNPKNREVMGLVDRATVVLANAAFTFDVSVMEEFVPLTSGLTVALASNAEILNPMLMAEFMETHGVDAMYGTPSYINMLLAIPQTRNAMKNIKVYDIGAEAFIPELYNKIKDINPDAYIMNGYGPTETTISCMMKVIEDPDDITIGRPNANVFCHIIDKNNNEVEKGQKGELLVCGEGVGRGYINLPENTAAAFVEFNGMRGYKTGDIARINENDEIEFHGREDGQVKYHGLRIELDEISGIMSKAAFIRSNTALVYENRILCLYYVLNNKIEVSQGQVRQYAKEHLAHYMIPDVFVELDEMPMTVNMKIDKNELPRPFIPDDVHGNAPQTEIQQKILDIVSAVQPDIHIGVETDLRDTGLTSLNFMVMIAEIGEAFQVGLNMAEFLDNPTIIDLEKLILSKPGVSGAEVKKDRYPMVPLQMFMYIEMIRNNTVDNVLPVVWIMDRSIDPDRLRSAVNKAAQNHPILFAGLSLEHDGDAFMIPGCAEDIEIPLNETTEQDLKKIRSDIVLEMINADDHPLFFFRMYRTEKSLYLFFKVAHVISDGESVELLFEDIASAYDGHEPKPEMMSMFAIGDEVFQTSESILYGQIVSYYMRLFSGKKNWTRIPEDDTGLKPGIDRYARTLSATREQIDGLEKRLKVSGNVLFIGLMALSESLQIKRAGIADDWTDITVAFSHSGRNDSRRSRTFGFLINEGFLRVSVLSEMSFSEYLRQIQDQVFEAMSYQAVPLEELNERYPGYMDYGYTYQTDPQAVSIGEKKVITKWLTVAEDCPEGTIEPDRASPDDTVKTSAACDEGLYKIWTQVYDYNEVTYELSYKVNVYKKERIEEMVSDVERMLLMAIEDEKTTLTLADLMEG